MKLSEKTTYQLSHCGNSVGKVLSGLDLPLEISEAEYSGSKQQLQSVYKVLGEKYGKKAVEDGEKHTASALASRRSQIAKGLWEYISDKVDMNNAGGGMKLAVIAAFRIGFDQAAYMALTGKDPQHAKGGFGANALREIRQATQHGDAALLLYRIRYWWARASVVKGGKRWIAKTHGQWADELGMEPRTFRTAYDRLVKLELIETMAAPFKGYPMTHLRPTPDAEILFKNALAVAAG